jgi:ABC-type Mn2+/Zn2+ transport system permease subunit
MNAAKTEKEHVDTAALAGAVLAGVLASFVEPGPFDLMSAVLGTTLITLLIAYLWNNPRTWGKSIAFSMVTAFSSLLILGFVLEMMSCKPKQVNAVTGKEESKVESTELAISWGIVTASVLIIDRAWVSRRTRSEETEGKRKRSHI